MSADVSIDSVHATRTLTLATTVKSIRIPAAIYGQLSGLRVYCAAAAGYQIDAQGGEPTSTVAPTADYMTLAANTYVPIEAAIHPPEGASDVWIGVWAVSGTPVLCIQPIPIGR
jgi:hypothetical protein